jgi:hypothetical protein
MATLAYQTATPKGVNIAFTAASAGGDALKWNDRGGLLVTNASGASITVTIATPGLNKYGNQISDITGAVAAGSTRLFAPLPKDLADPTVAPGNQVQVTYTATASVSVAAIQL